MKNAWAQRALLAAAVGLPVSGAWATNGPDVIVGDCSDIGNYTSSGAVGGLRAYAVGTTSCNIGSQVVPWVANTNHHPVIGQGVYKLKNGRFEQLGQSFLKHGFTALQGNLCGPCTANPNGSALGVGCSDPYGSGLNGGQSGIGPKWQVNATTGDYAYPYAGQGQGSFTTIERRVQVRDADLESTAGVLYFVAAMYVSPEDAAAITNGVHNNVNNESYRRATLNATNHDLNATDSTQRTKPAIMAWKDHGLGLNTPDPNVILNSHDVPGDGRFWVGAKATDLGTGLWHYEYAVQNISSDRAGASFSIPVPPNATIVNIGFRDVEYHSGEVQANTDWTSAVSGGAITWSTVAYTGVHPAGNEKTANALRWDTIYNFRFDSDVPPAGVNATLGLFKPPTAQSPATSVTSVVIGPSADGTPHPLNDSFATAPTVTDGTVVFSTTGAGTDGPAVACAGSAGQIDNDIWFRWTANGCGAGNATISSCGSAFNTKIAVYPGTGTPTAGSEIACNDDSGVCATGGGTLAVVSFPQQPGATYLVRVGGQGGASGTGMLTFSSANCPPNDAFANAITIPAYGTTAFDSTNASTDGPAACAGGAGTTTQIGADLWYRFTTTSCTTGMVTFATCGSSFDTKIAVYPNSAAVPAANTQLACNDNAAACGAGEAARSQVSIPQLPSTTYLVRVGGAVTGSSAAQGVGSLTISGPSCGPVPPVNDLCANAIRVGAGVEVLGSTALATGDGTASCASSGGSPDVWYYYIPATTAAVTVDLCNSSYDTALAIFTGSCGTLSEIACDDDACGNLWSRTSASMTAGTRYTIRVSGFSGNTGSFKLHVAGGGGIAGPTNDLCASRTTVSNGNTPFNTTGALTDGPAHASCDNAGSTQINGDVWFNYSATADGRVTFATCDAGTSFNTRIAVYSGTGCSNYEGRLLACNDDAATCTGGRSSVQANAVTGQAFTVRVGGTGTATGAGVLTISIAPPCPADFDGSGEVNANDISAYINAWYADITGGTTAADFNHDGETNGNDVSDYINVWYAAIVAGGTC